MKKDLRHWLLHRSEVEPDKIAILEGSTQITFSELSDLARSYAKWFVEREYERVALMMSNSMDMVAIIHALCYAGIELVLINARLSPHEVKWQLEFLDVNLVVVSPHFIGIKDRLNCQTILIEEIDSNRNLSQVAPLDLDRIACYVFTSGTTGTPKAVPLSYSNFYHSAKGSAERLGKKDDDSWLLTMPLYHLGGLSIVFRSVITSITINLVSKFDEQSIARLIASGRVTLLSVVPVMLRRLLPHLTNNGRLRLVLLGGAAAPIDLLEESFSQNIPVATTYGMTETCSQFATALPEFVRENPLSVGKPLPGGEVRIDNPDENGIGDILVRGPMVMSGYFGHPRRPVDEFFLTGDLGYLQEGNLFVVQRRVDLIISGGENIYPSEIEQQIIKHEAVVDVCVIPIVDPTWGQIPVGIVELASEIAKSELISYLSSRLASYKIPSRWYVCQGFPRTGSGKILRKKVIEDFPDFFREL